MKKIIGSLLLAGLIAGAVMAEAKTIPGKAVKTMAATAAPTAVKKHKKHKKHRKPATKTAPAKLK
ncbi:MAG TPA: hypothetical protein VFV58_24680 [Blastocatellia bacterium]|jgi:hypothetical protein|nr:hypothetical protein [Blastocatellia bacterium]